MKNALREVGIKMEWLQTKNFDFKVKEGWSKKYFEEKLKYKVLSYPDKKPVYNSFEEWFVDYGYDQGSSVFFDAQRDNAVINIRY